MQRRHLLAALSVTGLGAATGCTRLLGTACKPGDSALGTLYDSVHRMNDPGDVSVRGTILSVSSLDVVISDGTGYGRVRAPHRRKYNSSIVGAGECARFDASVRGENTRSSGYLSLEIESEDDFEILGDTNDPPEAPPAEPDATFFIEFVDDGVRLTKGGEDPVPAGNLELRSQPGSDFQIVPWTELADVSADTLVESDDTVGYDKSGQVVWSPEPYWGSPVSSFWEL